jgi:hypothetical protein
MLAFPCVRVNVPSGPGWIDGVPPAKPGISTELLFWSTRLMAPVLGLYCPESPNVLSELLAVMIAGAPLAEEIVTAAVLPAASAVAWW